MRTIVCKIIAGMLSVIPISASAQHIVKLDSVLQVIKEQNPLMKSIALRAQAMQSYSGGAGSWTAPEVGGGLWMVPYKRPEDARDKGQIMLSVQQKFENPGKRKARSNYAASKYGIEGERQDVAFNNLKADARASWYQWWVLERKKILLRQYESTITTVLKIARARYQNNESTLGSIYKTEGKLEEVKNMILTNESEIVRENIQLDELMNISGTERFSIDTVLLIDQAIQWSPDTAAVANRSAVRLIDKNIASMKLNQQIERAQARPDFNLSFSHMIPRGAGMPSQFMLLGMISIPIAPWASGGYKANLQGLGREIASLKSEREALVNETAGQGARTVLDIEVLKKQIESYEKRIIPVLKKNYDVTMLAYSENRETLPAVLDAWEGLIEAKFRQLDIVGQYLTSWVTLQRLTDK